MILLDTHVLIWLFMEDLRLGPAARRTIERTRTPGGLQVPPIAFWEIAMNVAKQRLVLGRSVSDWSAMVLGIANVGLAPFDASIAIDAGELADGLHGDPADRIIIATARALACPLVTADERINAYAERGHLQVIDARR